MQRIVAKVWVVIPVVLFLIQGIGVGVNSYMLLSVIALTPIVLLFCRNNSDILKDYFPILVFIFLLFLGMLYRDFPVKIPSIVFFVGITGLLLTFFGNIVFSKRKLNIFRSPQYLGLIVIVSLFVGLAIFSLKNVPVFDSVDYYCRLQSIASSWNSVDNYNSYYLVGHMASGMSIAYLPGAILFPTNPIGIHLMTILYAIWGILSFYNILCLITERTRRENSSFLICILTAAFAFSPWIFGMLDGINLDIFASLLTPILIYSILKKNESSFFFVSFLFVFSKEPYAFFYVFLLFGYLLYRIHINPSQTLIYSMLKECKGIIFEILLLFIYVAIFVVRGESNWLFVLGGSAKDEGTIKNILKNKFIPFGQYLFEHPKRFIALLILVVVLILLILWFERILTARVNISLTKIAHIGSAAVICAVMMCIIIAFHNDTKYVLNKLSEIFILNMHWLVSLVILYLLIYSRVKRVKHNEFFSFFCYLILPLFIGFTIFSILYIDFINPRYVAIGQIIVLMYCLVLLETYDVKGACYAISIPIFAVLACQSAFSIDPLSEAIFYSLDEYGKNMLIGCEWPTLNDTAVYNKEYFYYVRAIEKAMDEYTQNNFDEEIKVFFDGVYNPVFRNAVTKVDYYYDPIEKRLNADNRGIRIECIEEPLPQCLHICSVQKLNADDRFISYLSVSIGCKEE